MTRRTDIDHRRARSGSPLAYVVGCFFMSLLCGAAPAHARQVVDTTQAARFLARADSMRAALQAAPVDSVSADSVRGPGAILDSLARPVALHDLPRAVTQARWDVSDLLRSWAGSFLHDFGSDGWPDAWSPEGIDPARVSLSMDGIPFDDLVTGAPAWDLLPLGAVDGVRFNALSRSALFAVDADLRRFSGTRPVTEARYRSGGGLQAVGVIHAQNRSVGVGSTTRSLGFVFGYTGAGATGEYEGSRMRRKRQLFLRLSTVLGRWNLATQLVTNRQRVGAHAGVAPPGSAYETIYNRLLAGVVNADAVRERYRSDVSIRVSGPVVRRQADFTLYRTQHLLRHVQGGDSTAARVVRHGLDASLPLLGGSLPLSLSASLYRDGIATGTAVPSARARTVTSLSVLGRSTTDRLGLDYAGGLRSDGNVGAAGSLGVEWTPGKFRASARMASSPIHSSVVDRYGFGVTAPALAEAGSSGRLSRAALEMGLTIGELDLGTRLFVTRQTGGTVWQATTTGLQAVSPDSQLGWTGWVVTTAFREMTRHGLHGRIAATVPLAASAPATLAEAHEGSLPSLSADGTLGWRATLFQGDAVLDLRLEARAWTTMRGRRLHAPTGMLVLADDASRDVPGSVILDLRADVDIRTATVFIGMENLLSGTDLILGNQLVLDYPYPERRFRFGVFWPMFD